MNKSDVRPTLGKSILISLVIFALLVIAVLFLRSTVSPLRPIQETERTTRSFEILSVVLGLLAGGCMAGYFSFDYSKISSRHKTVALLVSWLFIGSIYLLIFLIIYTLRRSGALQIMDPWADVLLFLATYAFLNGLVLFENWKMGQFREDE